MTERNCSSCTVRLSRYNSSSLCSACHSSAPRGAVVPQWLWDSDPLRVALADLDLGAALEIIRTSAGLTQLEMAALLGWEQSAVARVEGGNRDTLYDVRKLLAAADALDMPREALAPLLLGNPDVTIEHTEGGMNIDRRQFHGTMFGLIAGAGLDRVQVPSKVDAGHVRYLRATVDRLYQQEPLVGAAALARGALRQYHRARRMLDEADYSSRVGAGLIQAAGALAVCVGWLTFDAGEPNLSRQLYSEALLLADEAGDDELSVRVMEKMALQSIHAARNGRATIAREAVRLAERAAELARRDTNPRLHALIAGREAVGHAMLGDTRAFSTAMKRAWREIDRGEVEGPPVWLRFVTPAEISVHEGLGRAHLAEYAAATRLYQDSLPTDQTPRNTANYRTLLAATLAREGDATEAIRHGLAVLPALEGKVISPRFLQDLRQVRALAEHHGADAEEFRIRYDKAADQAEKVT